MGHEQVRHHWREHAAKFKKPCMPPSHPKASRAVAPKLAPMTPVMTTIAIARDASAPTMEQMAIASGEVMLRDRVANRRASGRPSNLRMVKEAMCTGLNCSIRTSGDPKPNRRQQKQQRLQYSNSNSNNTSHNNNSDGIETSTTDNKKNKKNKNKDKNKVTTNTTLNVLLHYLDTRATTTATPKTRPWHKKTIDWVFPCRSTLITNDTIILYFIIPGHEGGSEKAGGGAEYRTARHLLRVLEDESPPPWRLK